MGTRWFQEEARSTATKLERRRPEEDQENGHQLGRGWRGRGGQEELEESCCVFDAGWTGNQGPGLCSAQLGVLLSEFHNAGLRRFRTRMIAVPDSGKSFTIGTTVSTQYRRRRTDGRTDRHVALRPRTAY